MPILANILITAAIAVTTFIGAYKYLPLDWLDTAQRSPILGSTITTIQGSDTLSSSRAVINANFLSLNTDKLESGSTASSLTITTLTNTTFNGVNASTSALSATSYLDIPDGANPTVNVTGEVAIDTTAASSSIHWSDGSTEYATFSTNSVSFTIPTTTPSTAATTTIIIAGSGRKNTMTAYGCNTTGGTSNVQIGNGTASTTMVVASNSLTTALTTVSSNNTFGQGQSRVIAVGTYSSTAVKQTTCTINFYYDPN